MNENKKQSTWWYRNWKWFVPFTCVATLAALALVITLFFFVLFSLMKSSDAYKTALATAKADTYVVEALGIPVNDRFYLTGNISIEGDSGYANFVIPIYGPNGKATLYVEAKKSHGLWKYSVLEVYIRKTDTTIDLIAPALLEP